MSDAPLHEILSNYKDTFSPPCDTPMSAAQLADTLCHAINGSGVDLKKVLSLLSALYDTVGDMVYDLIPAGLWRPRISTSAAQSFRTTENGNRRLSNL